MMQYLHASGAAREYVALAAVPAAAGATASTLLLGPVIRMGATGGKVIVEVRHGEIVLHYLEWTLAARAVLHLPGKRVLNAGHAVYFCSYVAGASLEACAVSTGTVENGISGGSAPVEIPPGKWYVQHISEIWLGVRVTYELDEMGMPGNPSYGGLVSVPVRLRGVALQNTGSTTLTSGGETVHENTYAGYAHINRISDGPFDTQASARAILPLWVESYPLCNRWYNDSGTEGDARCSWTMPDGSYSFDTENSSFPNVIKYLYGNAETQAAYSGRTYNALPLAEFGGFEDFLAVFPTQNIASSLYLHTIYEEVWPQ